MLPNVTAVDGPFHRRASDGRCPLVWNGTHIPQHPHTGLTRRTRLGIPPAEHRIVRRGRRSGWRERLSAVSSGNGTGMSGFERCGEVEQRAGTGVDERGMSADERFSTGIRFAPPPPSLLQDALLAVLCYTPRTYVYPRPLQGGNAC